MRIHQEYILFYILVMPWLGIWTRVLFSKNKSMSWFSDPFSRHIYYHWDWKSWICNQYITVMIPQLIIYASFFPLKFYQGNTTQSCIHIVHLYLCINIKSCRYFDKLWEAYLFFQYLNYYILHYYHIEMLCNLISLIQSNNLLK